MIKGVLSLEAKFQTRPPVNRVFRPTVDAFGGGPLESRRERRRGDQQGLRTKANPPYLEEPWAIRELGKYGRVPLAALTTR